MKQNGIYKKLNKTEFKLIGNEYWWIEDGKEMSACVPYTHIAYIPNDRGHTITTYIDDFAKAMETYPNGSDVYVFGGRYQYYIIQPYDVGTNIHTLGAEIISNLPPKQRRTKETIKRSKDTEDGETKIKKRGRPKKITDDNP